MGTESRPRAPGSTPRPAADGGKRQSRELTGASDDRGASTAGGAALAPSGCRRGPLPSGLRRSSSAWRRTSQSTCGAGGVPQQAESGRGWFARRRQRHSFGSSPSQQAASRASVFGEFSV